MFCHGDKERPFCFFGMIFFTHDNKAHPAIFCPCFFFLLGDNSQVATETGAKKKKKKKKT
jgi:hypothetical protein